MPHSSLEANGSRECAPDDRLREDSRAPVVIASEAKQSRARAVIASEAKQSIAPRKERMDCFAALAMTKNPHTTSTSRRDAPEALFSSAAQRGRGERRMPVAPAASCALGSGRTHTSNNEYTGITRRSRTQWF